jgi:hypothetical protein
MLSDVSAWAGDEPGDAGCDALRATLRSGLVVSMDIYLN